MAAPPWRATDQRTLHWYSQGHFDHQWPTHVTPESPGNAVHSREPKKWPLYLPPRRSYSHGIGCVRSVSASAGRMPKMGAPAPKAETPERFKLEKSSKWAGLICVLGIYRGDYLQRAHKRASMETGGTWVSEAALRYGRSVRPCGIVRGRLWVGEGEMTYSPKRRFWAYLSVFERSAMLAAVGNVGIDRRYSAGTVQDQNESSLSDSPGGKDPRLAGLFPTARGKRSLIGRSLSHGPRKKILDRQVSSPRPEEKDPRSAGLFPTARGERSSIGRSLPHGPRRKILDRQVSSPRPEEKDPRSAGLFPTARGERSSIGRSLHRGLSQRSSIGRSAAHPSGFDRGIPSHTRPVLTRWIGSRTSSNPTGEPSGLETTWPTVTDSATRVQKRPPRTRRLGCKADGLGLGDSAAMAALSRAKKARRRDATWLILPVVICLSKRLSHACESAKWKCERLITSVMVYLRERPSSYMDNRSNSRANTCDEPRTRFEAYLLERTESADSE